MDLPDLITAVDSHTEGEPTRVITAGLPEVAGATMVERSAYLRDRLDGVRTGLVHEPRGHDAMVLAFLLPPISAECCRGVVFANDVGYLGMCGHGTIGVATTLVNLGMVDVKEPVTVLCFDTPAGLVHAEVAVQDGLARAVKVRNVPSFLLHQDLEVPVAGLGRVRLDVAYGGNWFAILPEDEADTRVEFAELRHAMQRAVDIRQALQDAGIYGADPGTGAPQVIDHVEIYRELKGQGAPSARTLTLCPGLAYDRSPCGTGTSAKMAALWAKGELRLGETFVNESIIGTRFRGRLLAEVDAHGRRAVVPEIEGSAWITGHHRFVFDRGDPLRKGIPAFTRRS